MRACYSPAIAPLLFSCFAAFDAQAAVITSGCVNATACTLDELFAGGSIQVGALLFDNWSLIDADRIPGPAPDPTQIMVGGLEDGGADPGPGLRYEFGDELLIASGGLQFMTLQFAFEVNDILGRSPIKDHQLEMIDFTNAGNPGKVEGQLNVRDEVTTLSMAALGTALVESVISDSGGVNVLTNPDWIVFAPQAGLSVTTIINGTTLDQVQLAILDQRFSLLVPEPSTAAQIGFAGTVLLAFMARRHRKS
ncbi:MAG: hypothetical protein SFV18_20335 [Bryobacteraceae bacterium]|nr:hypothetical protein [Bryobacteraceae bacterium]